MILYRDFHLSEVCRCFKTQSNRKGSAGKRRVLPNSISDIINASAD